MVEMSQFLKESILSRRSIKLRLMTDDRGCHYATIDSGVVNWVNVENVSVSCCTYKEGLIEFFSYFICLKMLNLWNFVVVVLIVFKSLVV